MGFFWGEGGKGGKAGFFCLLVGAFLFCSVGWVWGFFVVLFGFWWGFFCFILLLS